MAKKNMNLFVVIALVVVAIFVFRGFQPAAAVDTGVQDQGVSFKVFTSDANGNIKREISVPVGPQSTVTFPGGGGALPGETHIIIQTQILALAEANVDTEVTNVIGSNSPGPDVYGPATALYITSFTLPPGASNIQNSEPIALTDLELGAVTFQIDVTANFFDAFGNAVDVSTFGTVIVNIVADTCSDGTLWGFCSNSNRGKFCDAGSLVDGAVANGCGCCLPAEGGEGTCGWIPQGDQCTNLICDAGGAASGACIPSTMNTQFPQYCELDGTETDACNMCAPCGLDYQNNADTGCSVPTDPALCEYQTYSTELSISLGSGA